MCQEKVKDQLNTSSSTTCHCLCTPEMGKRFDKFQQNMGKLPIVCITKKKEKKEYSHDLKIAMSSGAAGLKTDKKDKLTLTPYSHFPDTLLNATQCNSQGCRTAQCNKIHQLEQRFFCSCRGQQDATTFFLTLTP